MSRLRPRLQRLEGHAAPAPAPPPIAIEQAAPAAPVRFHQDGREVEMSPEEYRKRWPRERWPDAFPLTWSHQPWTADL